MKPRPTSVPPSAAQIRGPRLSWIRPPRMNDAANVTTAIVNVHDVCARVHPNSCSSGSTNTLHAYRVPSARFMHTPPTTGSQRFMVTLLRGDTSHGALLLDRAAASRLV